MIEHLDRLHRWARSKPPLYRVAIVSRILLALAFIPTGMVKLLGHRFTSISVDNPIGAFFEAMYQTGVYWRFIGLGQVVAGVLLLIPATSTLGAVMFFPIILNVTVITWALQFKGTIYITALMLLANTFLLCWDLHRLRSILVPSGREVDLPVAGALDPVERVGYVVGTAAGLVALLGTRSLTSGEVAQSGLLAGAGAALLVLVGWVRAALAGRKVATPS